MENFEACTPNTILDTWIPRVQTLEYLLREVRIYCICLKSPKPWERRFGRGRLAKIQTIALALGDY